MGTLPFRAGKLRRRISSFSISLISAYSFFLMFLFLYLSDLEFHRLSRLRRASNNLDVAWSVQISLAAIATKHKWREKYLRYVIWGLGSKENCQVYLSRVYTSKFHIWQFFIWQVYFFKTWHVSFWKSTLSVYRQVLSYEKLSYELKLTSSTRAK